jgi:putative membrane protein
MVMKCVIAIALCGLAGAVPAVAQPASPTPELHARTSAPTYVSMTNSSSNYEVESSKLILGTAANPDLRNFAQTMINDHGQLSSQIMAAAKAASIGNSTNLLPPEAAMLKDLRSIDKSKMERFYVDQQVMAHEKALALHQGYAAQGENAGLKAVAAQAVPIIQRHLDEIRRIQTAMGGPLPR